MMAMQRGLVLGKFMPPHAGHLYLVEFALAMCDQVDVVVGALADEPIPGELRFGWMRELAPDAHVHHLTDENPSLPEEHPDFWDIWRASLLRLLPKPPTHVFASEEYGARLAAELGAAFVPLDRTAGPFGGLSGTAIRKAPAKHWDALPGLVRPYFQRRIHVVGPESTGKSTLARELAERLGTRWVPEYARTWLERAGNTRGSDGTFDVRPGDMPIIARGQAASADALSEGAGSVLVLDTDALTTVLWSDELFGEVDPAVSAAAHGESPALTLLLDVDLPWEEDEVRYRPDQRRDFFRRFKAELEQRGRPYHVVRGSGTARTEAALAAIAALG